MRRPSSYGELLTLILAALGGLFLLLGLWGSAFSLPMRGGEAWMFAPLGLWLLSAAGLCAMLTAWQNLIRSRLLRDGTPVRGQVLSIKHHILVTWNTASCTNFPGKNSPWTLRCRYTWEGRDYTVTPPLPVEQVPGGHAGAGDLRGPLPSPPGGGGCGVPDLLSVTKKACPPGRDRPNDFTRGALCLRSKY